MATFTCKGRRDSDTIQPLHIERRWLAAHADFSVGKERGRHKMFGTSWYSGKTDGAPPLHIKGLRIDLNPNAGGMVAPEQEDQ